MTGGRRRLAAVAGAVALLVLAAGCGGGSPKGRYAGVSSTTATRAPEQEANADFHVLPVPQASVRNVQVSAGLAVQDQGPPH
jgi:hypothetical protein